MLNTLTRIAGIALACYIMLLAVWGFLIIGCVSASGDAWQQCGDNVLTDVVRTIYPWDLML